MTSGVGHGGDAVFAANEVCSARKMSDALLTVVDLTRVVDTPDFVSAAHGNLIQIP
jgi:hypothetical protein